MAQERDASRPLLEPPRHSPATDEVNRIAIRTQGLRNFLSSRKKHYIVLGLVALDVAALLANIFIELVHCDLQQGNPPMEWVGIARRSLSVAGLVFSSLFVVELLLCIAAFGLGYFSDWFHCLDGLIIVASFVVDLLSHGIVEEIASLVIIFRLFRFVKIVEEISVGAAERMDSMEAEMEKLREENTHLKARVEGSSQQQDV